MKIKKDFYIGITLALLALTIVFVTEQYFKPAYAVKSSVKLLSFAGAITVYRSYTRKKLTDVIHLHKLQKVKPILIFMLCFFVGTAIAFFALRDLIDLQSIKQSLISKENLTKSNCIFVFLYIIICNSFLEESFFRGFVSGIFQNKRVGGIVGAILFSLYHIGIFITWFNPFIFILCVVGLAAVGLFLQRLSEKFGSILASYITHACANAAINIIGAMLIFEVI